jgi:plasmid stabilization system protein ParE
MQHSVRISPAAEDDLIAIGDYIAQDSPAAAQRFIEKLRSRIATLRSFPARHGRAAEADLIGVLYTIDRSTVVIHAIRHGARRPLRPGEFRSRPE